MSAGPIDRRLLLQPVETRSDRVPVRRVRKAYEQVADQLRELIMTGQLSPGERLPNEALLASEFGVSRATVREALRVLTTQNLVRTAKGTGGGSYVTLPTVDHISEFLRSNINLLTESEDLTLAELVEARELLEVPAARLAATRRSEEDLDRIRGSIPGQPLALNTREQFVYNKGFHSALLDSCGNALLSIAAQPVFSALQTKLSRSTLGRRFHREINAQHRRIAEALEESNPEAAGHEMRRHLEFLVPFYERAWRDSGNRRHG
jgi:DNA-binding FadR family transcriptional regulator